MLRWSRLKKRWLERRLLNGRENRLSGNAFCEDGDDGDNKCVKSESTLNLRSLRKLLRAMTFSELKSLWAAVRSGGARISDCIETPGSFKDTQADPESSGEKALILCYQAFLTPHITDDDLWRLIPLSWCRLADPENGELSGNRKKICCNPYHYGLLVADIPSSSSGAIDRAVEGQTGPSFVRSHTNTLLDNDEKRNVEDYGEDTGFYSNTSGTHDSGLPGAYDSADGSNQIMEPDACVKPWCHIAYWEENRRLGPLISITEKTGLVYFDAPKAPDSMSCSSLRVASINRNADCSDPIRKTRSKIGLGFSIFRRRGAIWLYNRSESCIFIKSNTCFRNRSNPFRLKPGCCCRVHQVGLTVPRTAGGPEESPTALVSFVKGWGRTYVRPFITCCPCWVQVIFTS